MPTEVAPHLGGFISGPHGDEATWFPAMWTWMVERLEVRSVLDIGCGAGYSLNFFESLGIWARGIDGVDTGLSSFSCHDYTKGTFTPPAGPYDLGWCCEFVEHIEERFLPNLIPTFQACSYVAMTHAFPGQLGHHHVTLKDQSFWLGFFTAIGFEYMPDLTYESKRHAANDVPYNHWLRSGTILRRR